MDTHLTKNHRYVLAYILLFIAPFLLYLKTVGFGFIPSWDDAGYVLDNPYIKGVSLQNIKGAFTEIFVSNYAPIHILSYMFDHALWGLKPSGYHLTNILLHSINTIVLFTFIRRATGRIGVSFAVALLFSVHPLNVENVAWISERKTLLTTLFSLLALLSYDQFRHKGNKIYFGFALVLSVLAILSKPLAVILPLLMTAYEFFIINKPGFRRFLPLIPFYLIALSGAGLSVWVHLHTGGLGEENLSIDILFGTVYPTMLPVFWKYVKLIFLPFNLSGYYDTAVYSSWVSPAVSLAMISWTIVFAFVLLKGDNQVKFWFFWFWIWLLPVSNIIPIYVYYADRYMYMPAVGIMILACSLLDKTTSMISVNSNSSLHDDSQKAKPREHIHQTINVIVILIFCLYFINHAHQRIPVWHDDLTFWEDTVKKSPGHAKSHLNLGYAYETRGRLGDAEKAYLASVKLYPSPEAITNLRMVRTKAAYLKSKKALQER